MIWGAKNTQEEEEEPSAGLGLAGTGATHPPRPPPSSLPHPLSRSQGHPHPHPPGGRETGADRRRRQTDLRSELLYYRLSTGHVAFQHMLDCLLRSKVGLHGLTYDIAIEREKEKQDIMILGATVTIQAPTTWGQEEEEEPYSGLAGTGARRYTL